METTEMIEFLKQDHLRVVEDSQLLYDIKHTCENTVICFWKDGYYSSYNNNDDTSQSYPNLLSRLSSINKN
jgi:hypothetical protein